jgi:predicted DNA-binding transcriptional regulator AlpA
MPDYINRLVRDAHIAELIGMSKSWVRKQRMLRRRGVDHVLAIDPVMIGTVPRYRLADVEAWLCSHTNAAK